MWGSAMRGHEGSFVCADFSLPSEPQDLFDLGGTQLADEDLFKMVSGDFLGGFPSQISFQLFLEEKKKNQRQSDWKIFHFLSLRTSSDLLFC